MDRREFSKNTLMLGIGTLAGSAVTGQGQAAEHPGAFYEEPSKKLPVRRFDVIVAGAGTAGVVAAVAAARQGAKTALIEIKGYPGGTATEGGTALHSFYNLWKAFPGAKKRQVVRGIPQEIIDRLAKIGGTSGHAEMSQGYNYDSVCTAIDTEMYKLVTFEMLVESGVLVCVNTLLAGAIMDGPRIRGVIAESRSGREAFYAKSFVDCTAYGDLAGFAGAKYTEPNDYPVCNSIGVANVSVEKYHEFLRKHDALTERAEGVRSGADGQIVRLNGRSVNLPAGFAQEARKIGMSMTTTTVRDNYFMFVKLNLKLPVSPTNRDAVAQGELELRKRQARAIELFREYVPGCEKAFIARTSPKLNIRRGRLIECDYDVTHEDVIEARHFDDDVAAYGFHDSAPRLQIAGGGTYGIPYRALRVAGIENLLAAGMMITSDHRAHMSTRNTVACMAQGQATGTAAALCAAKNVGTRELPYGSLRDALQKGGVYFEA
ncbi:MAG: FAD-dependent oxidoreductase [Candidatus Nealsonbacteria bacterium]|nr:FAD-dependent oxidoreductase [Candidatus Nealsonbacteria bacterium]